MAGISAVHIINKWLWSYLQSTDAFSGDYGGINPIIPSQQTPEMVDMPTGLPFIVYNYKTSTDGQQYWLMHEVATYVVWDYQEARLRDIRETIMNLTQRLDDTARDINAFNDGAYGIVFNYVSARAMSVEPTTQESGRMGLMIVLNYDFTRQPGNVFVFA